MVNSVRSWSRRKSHPPRTASKNANFPTLSCTNIIVKKHPYLSQKSKEINTHKYINIYIYPTTATRPQEYSCKIPATHTPIHAPKRSCANSFHCTKVCQEIASATQDTRTLLSQLIMQQRFKKRR